MSEEFAKARSYALRLLVYRPRSKYELALRLERKGYADEVSRHVLDVLGGYGYVNDLGFARWWVEQRLGKRGFRGLRRELRDKGIHGEIIEQVLADLGGDAEYQAARRLVQKELNKRSGVAQFSRLAGMLQRRGFTGEIINKIRHSMRDEQWHWDLT